MKLSKSEAMMIPKTPFIGPLRPLKYGDNFVKFVTATNWNFRTLVLALTWFGSDVLQFHAVVVLSQSSEVCIAPGSWHVTIHDEAVWHAVLVRPDLATCPEKWLAPVQSHEPVDDDDEVRGQTDHHDEDVDGHGGQGAIAWRGAGMVLSLSKLSRY